jgi:ClpA/ClpB-like protein
MFERYTERARRTIFVARFEAAQLGATQIDTEHLLLGLARESRHLLSYLPALDNIDMLRNDVLASAAPHEVNATIDIPFSMASKRVLAYAAEEAESLGHPHIGTDHLFLGLLREPDTVAGKLCHKHGAELVKSRQLVMFSESAPRTTSTRQWQPNHDPAGCVVFVEANSGERVGIAGLGSIDRIPREGEYVILDDYQDRPRRFRVVEVVYHYHRQPPHATASAHRLSSITIRVLHISAGPKSSFDST